MPRRKRNVLTMPKSQYKRAASGGPSPGGRPRGRPKREPEDVGLQGPPKLVPQTNSHQCHICNKVLGHLSTLREHINSHTKEVAFPCKKCGRKFYRAQYLSTHLKVHYKEEQRHAVMENLPYKCTGGAGCSDAFETRQALAEHREKHKFPCAFCSRSATSIRLLNYHHLSHTGEFPEKCPKCKKWFTSSNTLAAHKCRRPRTETEGDPATSNGTGVGDVPNGNGGPAPLSQVSAHISVSIPPTENGSGSGNKDKEPKPMEADDVVTPGPDIADDESSDSESDSDEGEPNDLPEEPGLD